MILVDKLRQVIETLANRRQSMDAVIKLRNTIDTDTYLSQYMNTVKKKLRQGMDTSTIMKQAMDTLYT